ncbi:11132_t:CDS:2 [Acaulospora colombiana]|uniref:11132_t:CDS:1 n=1 Tax=Acaulospora colombiana TaxID=27376 RepID=A0ACA9KRX2_9GLOM|nr:11132_t:CDS:2 [Acaulospora colombiana]
MSQPRTRRESYAKTACIHCTKAKKRCSGDSTCNRCTERRLTCYYPIATKKRGPKFKYIIEDNSERQENPVNLTHPSDLTLEEIREEDIVQDFTIPLTSQISTQDYTQAELPSLSNYANLNVTNFSHSLNNDNLIGSNSGDCGLADPLQENFFPPLYSIQPFTQNSMASINTYDTTLPQEYYISNDLPCDDDHRFITQNDLLCDYPTFFTYPLEIYDFSLWEDSNGNDQ